MPRNYGGVFYMWRMKMLPQRKPKKVKRGSRWVSPSHCNFVRSHACCVCGSFERIEVAHVRIGTGAGMGQKPDDFWTISLCSDHHAEQHRIGEQSFEKKYSIDMKKLAEAFSKASPKRGEINERKAGPSEY